MKRMHTFTADDGTQFSTAKECKVYEGIIGLTKVLSNLEEESILQALDRVDLKIADAFERAGAIIAAKRRESGELKRAKNAPVSKP